MSYKLFIEKLPTTIQVADINNPDETLINITYQVLALQISNFIKNNTIPFDIKFDNNFIKFETYIDRDNSSYITANNLLTYSNFEYFLKTKVYKNFKDEFDNMIFLDSILNYDRSLNDWGFIVKGNSFKFFPYQINSIQNKHKIYFDDFDKYKLYQNNIVNERISIIKDIILKFKPLNYLSKDLYNTAYVKSLLDNRAFIIMYMFKNIGGLL